MVTLALGLGLVGMVGLGAWIGGGGFPAAGAGGRIESLLASLPGRTILGVGAGAISPSATFGTPGVDRDTGGYELLWAEVGGVGVFLVLACVGAFAMDTVRAWRRARSPWTRMMAPVALGVVVSNGIYFAFDASALRVPNLLVLAGVLGLAAAWQVHGADWRPEMFKRRLGAAHWPFVVGAVGLTVALGLAEPEMLGAAAPQISDKILHFGVFAVISLLVCYALGPYPGTRHLKTRILLAVLGTAVLGLAVEVGQLFVTADRTFETADIAANGLGAVLMGLGWWLFRREPPYPLELG